ncbi:MAG: copper chaperone PCu(A)C [Anaerolineales bacterium]|nr:copper chaperone PCu(A)C [Anaerolineales bacterium]
MKRFTLILLLLVAISIASCSGSTTEPAASAGTPGEMTIENVWGRNSPMAAANGAFYMTITNYTGTDDQLIGATAEVCSVAELHEMYMKENEVMGMRQVEGGVINIPDGESIELKAGGLHVMCLDKIRALELDEEIPITLTFANAGDIDVMAVIRESAVEDMEGMDHDN